MLVYDIEIKNAVPERGGKTPYDNLGVKYCSGWDDKKNMGISVLAVYDFETGMSRIFCDDNKEDFKALLDESDFICGFNNHRFDDPVVMECWGILIPPEKSYDILVEIWKGIGLPLEFNFRTHGGLSLNEMARVNLGYEKSGSGAMAPVNWQLGKIGNVIDYCLHDVWLTTRLLIEMEETCNRTGSTKFMLTNPKNGNTFFINPPSLKEHRLDERLVL